MAKEIEEIKQLATEMVPFIIDFIHFGERIGPPPPGEHDDDCDDCRMYAAAQVWKWRFESGEIEQITGCTLRP